MKVFEGVLRVIQRAITVLSGFTDTLGAAFVAPRWQQISAKYIAYFTTIVSFFWFATMLIGLRRMNSDDMNYELQSAAFWDEFGLKTLVTLPFRLARFSPFCKLIEQIMAVLQPSRYTYDILNIGSVVAFLGALWWLIARFSSRLFACLVLFSICALFPLHFYYTIPQSYPVEMMYSLTFLFLAAGAIDIHLLTKSRASLVWGCVFFFISVTGNEFNPVLNTLCLLVTIIARVRAQHIATPRRVIVWLGWVVTLYIGIYISNAVYHRVVLGEVSARMTPQLDPSVWGYTLWLHLRTSILPVGLIDGIHLVRTNLQFGYKAPPEFTYEVFFGGQQDWVSMGVVFIAAVVAWYVMLRNVKVQEQFRAVILWTGVLFIFVPAAIVSTSSTYQVNFAHEYQNGHVSTFHVHVGLMLLIVLFAHRYWHTYRTTVVGKVGGILLLCLLAGFQTIVFRYNTTNRQLMNYSMQRWEAVNLLASYFHESGMSNEPVTYVTRTLSTSFAVAREPRYPAGTPSYWSRYAQSVGKIPVAFVHEKKGQQIVPAYPRFEFAVQPSGDPLSFLISPCTDDTSCAEIVVLSAIPVAQTVHLDAKTKLSIAVEEWKCTDICVAHETVRFDSGVPVPYVVPVADDASLLRQAITAPTGRFTKYFGFKSP